MPEDEAPREEHATREKVAELIDKFIDPGQISFFISINKSTNKVDMTHTAHQPIEHLMMIEIVSKAIGDLLLRPVVTELHAAAQMRRILQPAPMDVLRQRQFQYENDRKLLEEQKAAGMNRVLALPQYNNPHLVDPNGIPFRMRD